ncbi:hypothetical protein [Liquorilactobacillus hordei]|uniref:Uncharacterized protein n=1 Tax=Liquorilactobacillus hordei DSM 19519 TaxID=1423759 RepID=A0A0R1MJ80_9LACO|nr:hypothetical protein [Liquorilactobacillus hordei]KRL07974.1 hypothetical protein FC92_GL001043 [Liquorilactobacillus hordei DSM 19519]QYH51082.1 hypothetical protein G6O70_00540 [Liquorilactobacillus hordei DSM 19519]
MTYEEATTKLKEIDLRITVDRAWSAVFAITLPYKTDLHETANFNIDTNKIKTGLIVGEDVAHFLCDPLALRVVTEVAVPLMNTPLNERSK